MPIEEQEITLADYGKILQKRIWIVFIVFFLIFSSTFIYTKLEVPLYRASIELKVERKLGGEPSLSVLLFPIHDLAAEIQLLKSLPIIKKAIEKVEVLPENPVLREQQLSVLARSYQRSIKVEQVVDTNIINIQTFSSDPQKTAMLANAIVDAFSEDGIESVKRKQAQVVLDYTEAKVNELRTKLEEGEEALIKFEQNERALVVTPEVKKTLDRMTIDRTFEFESEMFEIKKNLKKLELIINNRVTNEELKYFSENELSSNFIFIGLKRRLLELEFERFLLLIDYTKDHPRVVEQNNIISGIKAKMVNIVMEYKRIPPDSKLKEDVLLIVDKLFVEIKREVLFRIINKFYNDSGSLSPDQLKYQELKRSVDKTLEVYNQYLDKREEANLAIATDLSEVSVISPAVIPRKPIKPNERINYMVGAVIGLLLGMMMAFISEGLDASIGSIQDLEKLINYPILGIIPHLKGKDIVLKTEDKDGKRNMVTIFDPNSIATESFITLRTNLVHIMENENKKVMLFTSSGKNEGKTTVSINVAISLAQLGKKTLLIEANLRRPIIYQAFGLNKGPGLTDILIGRTSWKDAVKTSTDLLLGEVGLDKFLKFHGLENLSIITSGESVLNPSIILDSKSLGELFEQLKSEYDAVIVDCAPALTVADSSVLGKKVDGVVIVSQFGLIKKETLKQVNSHFKNVGAEITGIILNQARPKTLVSSTIDSRHFLGDGRKV